MSRDPRFDVRGPDEFEERDYPVPVSALKGGRNKANWPVIAAGVCPECGAYPACGPGPERGYQCQANSL